MEAPVVASTSNKGSSFGFHFGHPSLPLLQGRLVMPVGLKRIKHLSMGWLQHFKGPL